MSVAFTKIDYSIRSEINCDLSDQWIVAIKDGGCSRLSPSQNFLLARAISSRLWKTQDEPEQSW